VSFLDFVGTVETVFQHEVVNPARQAVGTVVEVAGKVGEVAIKYLPVSDEPEGSPDGIDLERWQSSLDPNKLVTQISIPGTHDSAAVSNLLALIPLVQTQKWDIDEQLRYGVRYFDLRGYFDTLLGQVGACHGIPLPIDFPTIFAKMYNFLRAHPTEFLLVQVAHETGQQLDKFSDEYFAEKFWDTIQPYVEEFWNLQETVPTVGRLRGRIQLVRRFQTKRPSKTGIDVNDFYTSTTSTVKRIIQDYFDMRKGDDNVELNVGQGMEKKTRLIREQMVESSHAGPDVLCLNFTSAVHGIGDPKTYALMMGEGTFGLNQRFKDALIQDFKLDGNGRRPGGEPVKIGVVLMDYINKDLCRLIIRTNGVY
jgi:1-phosphatidylinositol phosphodiesterase